MERVYNSCDHGLSPWREFTTAVIVETAQYWNIVVAYYKSVLTNSAPKFCN